MEAERLRTLAQSVAGYGSVHRRWLHQHPELSLQEYETQRYLAERLRELGLVPETGRAGGTGLRAVIEGGTPGKAVALRADIDALPIAEETGLPFASGNAGVMHACGHDVHTAILLATARALLTLRDQLPGRVVLLFQPAEEAGGGASVMIEQGCLQNPAVDAIFGLHVSPWMEAGRMALGAGPQAASPDEFSITVCGRGGHAADPHITTDPMPVAAQIILALQQVVSRQVNPMLPAVLSICQIHGGSANNIIPDEVTLSGTVRTLNADLRQTLARRIEAVATGVAAAFGASVRFAYDWSYPVLVNDPAMTELGRRAAVDLLGAEAVEEAWPSMGGEDFAYYLQQVPGTFAYLGCRSPGTDPEADGLHTSRLAVDERCLEVGVAYYLSVVTRFLCGEG